MRSPFVLEWRQLEEDSCRSGHFDPVAGGRKSLARYQHDSSTFTTSSATASSTTTCPFTLAGAGMALLVLTPRAEDPSYGLSHSLPDDRFVHRHPARPTKERHADENSASSEATSQEP